MSYIKIADPFHQLLLLCPLLGLAPIPAVFMIVKVVFENGQYGSLEFLVGGTTV
jgi:hypothetical protein